MWPSKYKIRKNAFPAGALPQTPLEELTTDNAPRSLVSWAGDTVDSPAVGAHRYLRGGNAPKYFFSEMPIV